MNLAPALPARAQRTCALTVPIRGIAMVNRSPMVKISRSLEPAAFVGNVAHDDGQVGSVGAVHDRLDFDRKPVLPADPSMHALHNEAPLSTARL